FLSGLRHTRLQGDWSSDVCSSDLYDRTYEEEGVDYPPGYVRWTEQRNMEAFLGLVAAGTVHPSRLVSHRIPIAGAERAYQIVTRSEERRVGKESRSFSTTQRTH